MPPEETIDLTDFKFACPLCDQHLACANSLRGTQIHCPSCQKVITVPPSLRLAFHSSAVWTDPEIFPPLRLERPPLPVRIVSETKKEKI